MGIFDFFVETLPDLPPGRNRSHYYGVEKPYKRNKNRIPWKDHERNYYRQLDRYLKARERYHWANGHY